MININSETAWIIFGLSAQGLFFTRFLASWIASEKAKKTVIPVHFWYLSIAGAVFTLVYSIHRKDIVFIFSQSLAMIIYLRSLIIHQKSKKLSNE